MPTSKDITLNIAHNKLLHVKALVAETLQTSVGQPKETGPAYVTTNLRNSNVTILQVAFSVEVELAVGEALRERVLEFDLDGGHCV